MFQFKNFAHILQGRMGW